MALADAPAPATPDPCAASVAREIALLHGDRAAAAEAMGTFKQLSEEFLGIFAPDVERCEAGHDTEAEPDAARRVGCETCWGDDPVAVKENMLGTYDAYSTLVSRSHFGVSLIRCRTCSQLFASIFTEYIDWQDSDDAQYSVIVPISRPEADALITGHIDVYAIGNLAAGRRHLHSDWPTGAAKKVYWSESAFTIDDGD